MLGASRRIRSTHPPSSARPACANGDNATVSAAHNWNFAVSGLAHLLVDPEATESEFLERFGRVNTQRDNSYTAARNSLQVATDRLDPVPIFQWRSPDHAD